MIEAQSGELPREGEDARHQPFPDHQVAPDRSKRWFGFWMLGLALLAVPVIGYLLLGAVVSLMFWDLGENDQVIPDNQAREQMVSVLKESYGTTLDPADQIIEAHRTSGGMQGDGTNWYLIRLASASTRRFEADFAAHASVKPLARDAARWINPAFIKPLGWESGPPPAARVFNFNDRDGTCAIFFGDKFFYRFDHF